MKLAANLSLLYPGLPMAQRIEAAAQDGFEGVEILAPYDMEPEALAALLRAHGVKLVLINTPLGPNGEKGLASLPGREAEFEAGLRQAFAVCQATGCRAIHVMAGQVPEGGDRAQHEATLIANLRHMAPVAAQAGITLTLEALNRQDVPRYFYYVADQAVEILQAVDHPAVRLQFDFYHSQREKLDLNGTLRRLLPWVHHVQFAHVEGRHEPDPTDPAVAAVLETLVQARYPGWIGCEYTPAGDPHEGLKWRDAYHALVRRP
ncbi:hydroxypyruvate isomerase family protein [Bordetella sp. 02P26C-1]|uniref:hydroxypyruvate isomerase family protein n=1 Tax=Bordetella sp. 02P26C-1 TaxID=2683195 RepID=UPI0013540FF6|nr:TIM barrel protein [Bordetella sp. 02P26C-1]MVW79792.1 TIM barrel protein [Bordetella sp. 02P26C-1]